MVGKENKRRCGARNVDGKRCAQWALAGSGPPRCRMHDAGFLGEESSWRCQARTRKGKRCRNAVVEGREVCSAHAWREMASEDERRADRTCTAVGKKGRRCRKWAIAGSEPALCAMHSTRHAPRGRQRCQARTRAGRRCRAWAVRKSRSGRGLCNLHADGQRRPGAGERCTATTASGALCTRWAVRGSAEEFGARLCSAHLPAGDARKVYVRLPGLDERRCRAMTLDGARCTKWAMDAEEAQGMCWLHAFPHRNPSITHGYYCRIPIHTQSQQAAILRIAEEGPALTAEVLLVRLKLRGVMAYLSNGERSCDETNRAALCIIQGVRAVARLQEAKQTLDSIYWGPNSAGRTGALLEYMKQQSAPAT